MKSTIASLLVVCTCTAFSQKDTTLIKKELPVVFTTTDKDSTSEIPVQFTFFYPLGTNGVKSPQRANNFSFNALYGVNGGLEGTEIGGLVNVNTHDVKGVQIAGISNITAGSSTGTIISGIANIVSDSANGIFIAGISNIAGDSSSGFHVGGISNTVNGTFNGGQLAGIGNLNNGDVNGFQIAGISNVTNGQVNGLQLSGIANITHGTTTGAQLGFLNFSSHMNGIQVGFLNVAGESEHIIPIGFLSLVKNGYRALEVSTSETLYGNLAFKLGVEKFYNTFRFGIGSEKGESYLSYGYGIGTLIAFNEKNKLGLDLSANNIVKDLWNNWDLDLLNRLELTYQRHIGKHLSVFAGPALNVYVSQKLIDGNYGSIHVPYTLYSDTWSDGQLSMWIGLQAGAAIRF